MKNKLKSKNRKEKVKMKKINASKKPETKTRFLEVPRTFPKQVRKEKIDWTAPIRIS